MNLDKIEVFCRKAQEVFGVGASLSRSDIQEIVTKFNLSYPYWLVNNSEYKVERGLYKIPEVSSVENPSTSSPPPPSFVDETQTQDSTQSLSSAGKTHPAPRPTEVWVTENDTRSLIPQKFPGYVSFGFFSDLKSIIASKIFYPLFISGPSGNGKTLMVEQACAETKRNCIRINLSTETDQIDLLGGPSLENGNMVTKDGPVIIAMKTGSVLILDECDRASHKLLCLMAILEGKPYYNKNNNEVIYPKEGFNIVATANTNGRGSEDGKYLSQILDDAFLERFPITILQDFPTVKTETKIVKSALKRYNIEDDIFAGTLVQWANNIRKTAIDGGVDDVISTRRLVHICQAYSIFKDKKKAVNLCLNRFGESVRESFMSLFTKLLVEEENDVIPPAPAPDKDSVVDNSAYGTGIFGPGYAKTPFMTIP